MNKNVKIMLKCAVLIAAVTGVVACKTGPEYERPALDMPDGYKSMAEHESGQQEVDREWWRLFQDPELDRLCEHALEGNLGLKSAMARVAQARASVLSVKSGFYPVVTTGTSATRSGTPAQTISNDTDKLSEVSSALGQVTSLLGAANTVAQGKIPSTGAISSSQVSATGTGVSSNISNSFRIPFDLSYEIDIWGRVQHSYEQAQAEAQATVYEYEVVRQTLLADIARNYFTLRLLDTQQQILNQNLALYAEQAQLTRQQYDAGLVNETNALQAEIQLEATRAQAADTDRQRANTEHAIAILTGCAPADFSLAVKPLEAALPAIPTGLPAELLCRRPDIAAAEQSLMAACAGIGMAEAEFYPSIKLMGSAGLQSAKIEDVIDWQSRSWSIGPNISIPIFKGGQLKANLQQAKARYEESEIAYRETILGAFQDVEDSLTDIAARAAEYEARTKAVAAAREYLRLTKIQYESGMIDYLHVITAEQTLMSNELSEAQIINDRLAATVLLIKAIGGGWNVDGTSPEGSALL